MPASYFVAKDGRVWMQWHWEYDALRDNTTKAERRFLPALNEALRLISGKSKVPNLDDIRINLALVYKVNYRFDESEKILRTIIENAIADGTNTATTLRASHVLAAVLPQRNRFSKAHPYDEADHFCRRALLGRRRLLGEAHPSCRETMILAIEICKAREENEIAKACEAALPVEETPAYPLNLIRSIKVFSNAKTPFPSGLNVWKRRRNQLS